MDFIRSKFGTNEPLPGEHFFPNNNNKDNLYQSYYLQTLYFKDSPLPRLLPRHFNSRSSGSLYRYSCTK